MPVVGARTKITELGKPKRTKFTELGKRNLFFLCAHTFILYFWGKDFFPLFSLLNFFHSYSRLQSRASHWYNFPRGEKRDTDCKLWHELIHNTIARLFHTLAWLSGSALLHPCMLPRRVEVLERRMDLWTLLDLPSHPPTTMMTPTPSTIQIEGGKVLTSWIPLDPCAQKFSVLTASSPAS